MTSGHTSEAWSIHAGNDFDVGSLTVGESLPRVWQTMFSDRAGEVALDGDTGRVTYHELDDLTRRVATGLAATGVEPGDRVAIYAPTSIQFIATYVATLRRGAVFVPINTAYRAAEISGILRDAEPKLLGVDHPESAQVAREARADIRLLDLVGSVPSAETSFAELAKADPHGSVDQAVGQDPAMLVFTSGTTGASKAVVLSHRNLLAGTRSVLLAWGWTQADRLLLCLPLFHLHGLGVGLNGTLTVGAQAVVHSGFDAGRVLQDIEEHRATMFFGVPTMYRRLVEQSVTADSSSLRLLVSGSAPLPETLFHEISDRFGTEPLERYGMSETLMNISNPLHGERRPGSVGVPLPGVEVRLVNEGKDVSHGEDGEIWLRGPNVFAGYDNNDEANRRSFVGGWFRSGDLARSDADGYIRITGRLKDLIITGGYNVSPREVEEALSGHPAVVEAAVIGTPSDEWGEEVTAFVVVRSGEVLDSDEIRAWCTQALARFKVPKRVHFVDDLPRNALGKLQRHRLKDH